jgi:hypothetical protein
MLMPIAKVKNESNNAILPRIISILVKTDRFKNVNAEKVSSARHPSQYRSSWYYR